MPQAIVEVLLRPALRRLRHPLPDPTPSLFSFNSPLGACETCRGFGRMIGIDFGLVIPDEGKTLPKARSGRGRRRASSECQDDLVKFAGKRGMPLDIRGASSRRAAAPWVIEGEGLGELAQILARQVVWRASASSSGSRPRATRCTSACCSRSTAPTRRARLRRRAPQARGAALAARHARTTPTRVLAPREALSRRMASRSSDDSLRALPGLSVHDLMLLPIERARDFIASSAAGAAR